MRDNTQKTDAGTGPTGRKKALAVVLMALALVYDIVPMDLISDFLVFFGWSDDLLLTALAAVNLAGKFDLRPGGVMKWVAVGVLVVVLTSAALVTYLLIRLGMYLFGGAG